MRLQTNLGKFSHRFFLYTSLLVLMVVLSGVGFCGRAGEGKTVVRMAIWGTDAEEPLKELAREYETLHPDRHIEIELQTGQSYDIWMTIQLISGHPPQIMQSQWYWSWTFGHKGKLMQVDPILERVNPYTGKRWIDQFYKARLDSVRDPQGRLFIIPHDQVKTAMFYNKNIFKKLGLTPPKTWHEFMQLCQKIADAGYIPIGVAGVSTTGIIEWNVNVFFDSVYRDEVPQLDVLHPDGFVDLEETIRGYRKGIINPLDEQYKEIWRIFKSWSRYWQKGFVSSSETDVSRLFLDSRCVMVMDGVWRVKYLKLDIEDLPEEKQFEFGVFPLPNITEETSPYFNQPLGSVGSVGAGYVIPTGLSEDELEVAVDWLMWLITPKNVERLRGVLLLPCIKGVELPPEYEGFRPLMDGTFPDLKIFESNIFPDRQAWDEWFKNFQLYMTDNITLDEFSHRLEKIINDGIDRVMKIYKYDTSKW